MATAGDININIDNFAASSKGPKRKREQQDIEMEVELQNNTEAGEASNQAGEIKRKKLDADSKEGRKIYIPARRYKQLKGNWEAICGPLKNYLKLNVRYNTKSRNVELVLAPSTPDIANLQKGADFVQAFVYGFEVADALALLRMDDLFVDTFEIKDVKTLQGDHLSRTIGRVAGKGGRTKYTIENATQTRIVMNDSKIHILGSFQKIALARRTISNLIVGAAPSKVYGKLRSAANNIAGM